MKRTVMAAQSGQCPSVARLRPVERATIHGLHERLLTMCGLVGFLAPAGFEATAAAAVLRGMTDVLVHRGPDDSGNWIDGRAGVAFGHRRLSIIELSAAGHQPMISRSRRFVLAFNGEIYNHLDLRAALGSPPWRGHSDTETLLAAIERWGIETTLQRTAGMFALALWDSAERILFLARDRMGEKPLYYGWQQHTFLFASELKALRQHPDFRAGIDRTAVDLYARNGYIPAPRSIYRDIHKLAPGTILRIAHSSARRDMHAEPYWSLRNVIASSTQQRFAGSEQDVIDELEQVLANSIREQQLSDVPVGAFLSGGTDSSAVVALMQSRAARAVKTFTIGFEEAEYNEAHHARSVAEHLGTEHTELYVSPQDAMNVIPDLATIYDEPFADISQIPTVLVSRLARRAVTVALSGDGGDELFCGYDRYPHTAGRWRSLERVPRVVRRAMRLLLPTGAAKQALDCESVDEFYRFINMQWKGFPRLVNGAGDSAAPEPAPIELQHSCERMMYADALGYLPDDILVKLDRAAMSTSLETRVPMLDHRVVEFAWRLPIGIKYKEGVAKWPLKQVLYRHVPRSLLDRPKRGFAVPMYDWLRGPLRGWADDLLSEHRLRRDGFFAPAAIRSEWDDHLSGNRDRQYGLWTILMFNAWLESTTAVSVTGARPARSAGKA